MPKPYSLDLRERVAGFVEAGHSRHAAAVHFGVSVSFVVKLMTALGVSGRLDPKPSGGRRHAKLELHRAFLLALVGEKEDITMPERAGGCDRYEGRPCLVIALADPSRLSLQKKRCWPASKVAPRSARRAKIGKNTASRGCGLSQIDWSSLTRPAPPRR